MANLVLGAGGAAATAYTIDQSLRFNSADSAYLNRAYTGSDAQKATWSFWFKRSKLDANQLLFWFGGSSSPLHRCYSYIKSSNVIEFFTYIASGTTGEYDTVSQFLDPAAWNHLVMSADTTQATPANRMKMFLNGVELRTSETLPIDIAPTQDNTLGFTDTSSSQQWIGERGDGAYDEYIDGYLAEFYFIQGTQYDADDFGELDTDTNQWIPKDASGLTFGTNGFYLDFADSADLGKDVSGEGNDLTSTNLAATDQVKDSPTNNFCTLNPLIPPATTRPTYREGNLEAEYPSNNQEGLAGTVGVPSGKWYWEINIIEGAEHVIGVVGDNSSLIWDGGANQYLASSAIMYEDGGSVYTDGSGAATFAGYTAGDIMGLALNVDDSEITFYKNNSSQGTSSFGTNLTAASFVTSGGSLYDSTDCYNFGQDSSFAGAETAGGNQDSNGVGDFYYTPPTDFLALCTSNLPDPSIKLPGEHFNTVLWTGDGVNPRTITGVGFEDGMTWLKSRSQVSSNQLFGQVRGAGEVLYTNTTAAQATDDANGHISAWTADGFTLSGSSSNNDLNGDTYTYVAWNWLAGTAPTADNSAGAGATPTAGSVKIDGSNLGSALAGSTAATRLSANTTNGFSIITWAGNGTSNSTIAHGLTQVPELFISKALNNGTDYWAVYGKPLGQGYLALNDPGAYSSGDDRWGTNAPTASVMNLGYAGSTNTTSRDYVGYCFHSVEGYSKVGSYEGNGNDDGTFVYLGFRPAFTLVKRTDVAETWWLEDDKRNTYNPQSKLLYADGTNAEATEINKDYVSNGMKMRLNNANWNASGGTYLYYACADYPFKYSPAR